MAIKEETMYGVIQKLDNMEQESYFYRRLIEKMMDFISKYYSEPDITTISCLVDAYSKSMECVYSEYCMSSFISKWRWKKRLREQFQNIQQLYIRYIVLAL